MNQKGIIFPTPILPYDNEPCQMSPFSDERWEIDRQENMKRREIHRDLVFKNVKQVQNPPLVEEVFCKTEETEPPAKLFPENEVNVQKLEPWPEVKNDKHKKELFHFESRPPFKVKTLADIQYESPRPPNLFPLLKFPEKRGGLEVLYRPANSYVAPLIGSAHERHEEGPKTTHIGESKDVKCDRGTSGMEVLYRSPSNYLTSITGNISDNEEGGPRWPQFAEFKDIKFDKAFHCGVSVPFWQFK